jgi:hypothetical protein
MPLSNEQIFALQRAQRLGLRTEIVQAELVKGQQKAKFTKWSSDLDTATVIGAVCYLPSVDTEKSVLGDNLLSKSKAASSVLHISHHNSNVLKIPLRLLQTENKNMIYVPLEPITGLDNNQSHIMFSEVSTVDGVVEIVFITA